MEPDNEAACSPAKAGAFGNAAFFSSCGRQRCPSAELPKAQPKKQNVFRILLMSFVWCEPIPDILLE